MVLSELPREKSPVTPPGIDLGTVLLIAQRLNHFAIPGPIYIYIYLFIYLFIYSAWCAMGAERNVRVKPGGMNTYH